MNPSRLVAAFSYALSNVLQQHEAEQLPDESAMKLGLLAQLARRLDVTLNTVIQAAWAMLLSRHSGETDVVFGATRACRKGALDGQEQMVGVFINTLPVRAHLDPGATWLN